MRTKIHDVARSARVSPTTVSRAFVRPALLRADTLERVLAAAKALDYHPNRAASSLSTGKTGNIGIVVPDLSNPFYPAIVRGAQLRAHQAGYAVLLVDSDEDPDAESSLTHTLAKQADGVIVCAPFASDSQLRRLAQKTAIVLVNRRLGGVAAVLMDVAHGMRQAVSHLHALGHRRCAYLGGPRASWSNRERLRGLHAGIRAKGMTLLEFGPFEPKFDGGLEGAERVIGSGVTAVIAYNDLMALGVLSHFASSGVCVPGEISVVGFDDLLFASMSAPPLTTVSMPMEAAGRAAVELLLARLTGDDGGAVNATPSDLELATQLIARGTTAPPPAISSFAGCGAREGAAISRTPAE